MAHNTLCLHLTEERELSQILYRKILGLTKIYEPNKDLRMLLSEEMFVKINQAAFYQVMGYLFQIYDPAEFKRRFFWPLVDKKTESVFCTSTRDYLKHLNEKHHLNWTDAISYLVMKPGGIKFILFLLKIVDFIIDHLLKQKEKQILGRKMCGSDAGSTYTSSETITKEQLTDIYKKNVFLKEFSSAYLKTIRDITETLEEKIRILKEQFFKLSDDTGIDREYLLSSKFLNDLKAHVIDLYEQRITKSKQYTQNFNAPVQKLLNKTQEFHEKQENYENNMQKYFHQLKSLQSTFPELEVSEEESSLEIQSNLLRYLIDAYNCLQPSMQNDLDYCNNLDNPNREGIVDDMKQFADQLVKMEQDLTDFKQKLMQKIDVKKSVASNFLGKPSSSSHLQMETPVVLNRQTEALNDLLTKVIKAPPIKLNLASEQESKLPLISLSNQDNQFKIPEVIQIPKNQAPTQVNRLNTLKDISIKDDGITADVSMNESKYRLIKNPLELLLSSQNKKNIVNESEKKVNEIEWQEAENFERKTTLILEDLVKSSAKELNQLPLNKLNNLPVNEFSFIECKSNLTSKSQQKSFGDDIFMQSTSSPFTPLGSQEGTCIEKMSANLNRSLYERNIDCVKNLSIIKKVKNISKDALNMSLSPSGRLEVLRTDSLQNSIDAKNSISLAKRKINMTSVSVNCENQNNTTEEDCIQKNDARCGKFMASSTSASESKDLSQGVNKMFDFMAFEISGDESQNNIFNITDGVLNDMKF